MAVEDVGTLVIGAGQAGLAMSGHLTARGLPHLVVERARIAERWRSERWDSLVANGPAWHDRFPDQQFEGNPDRFATKDEIVAYFETYAQKIAAPLRCGVEVTSLRRRETGDGFLAETPQGLIAARNVVAATGPFQRPVLPADIPAEAVPFQIHSSAYRNPAALPGGVVLVIGAGSSGTQIADELLRAGRQVYLSVGPHDRPPRRYRGHDFVWWLGALGKWDATAVTPGNEHVTIAVSGAHGGQTVDFRRLARRGMNLLGRAEGFRDGAIRFAPDLAASITRGDRNYLSVLDEADAYAARNGLDLPEDPDARHIEPDPHCVTHPTLALDPKAAGISAIIWATGYELDFSWIRIDGFGSGRPRHQRGVSAVPGLYFLGLPWLSRRASAFIWGVWRDAEYLAAHIAAR